MWSNFFLVCMHRWRILKFPDHRHKSAGAITRSVKNTRDKSSKRAQRPARYNGIFRPTRTLLRCALLRVQLNRTPTLSTRILHTYVEAQATLRTTQPVRGRNLNARASLDQEPSF